MLTAEGLQPRAGDTDPNIVCDYVRPQDENEYEKVPPYVAGFHCTACDWWAVFELAPDDDAETIREQAILDHDS